MPRLNSNSATSHLWASCPPVCDAVSSFIRVGSCCRWWCLCTGNELRTVPGFLFVLKNSTNQSNTKTQY